MTSTAPEAPGGMAAAVLAVAAQPQEARTLSSFSPRPPLFLKPKPCVTFVARSTAPKSYPGALKSDFRSLDGGRWQAGPLASVGQRPERRGQHRGRERSLQGLSILSIAALRDAARENGRSSGRAVLLLCSKRQSPFTLRRSLLLGPSEGCGPRLSTTGICMGVIYGRGPSESTGGGRKLNLTLRTRAPARCGHEPYAKCQPLVRSENP